MLPMQAAVPALALKNISVTFVSDGTARYTAIRDATLTVRPGWPLRIIVHKDLILKPYRLP